MRSCSSQSSRGVAGKGISGFALAGTIGCGHDDRAADRAAPSPELRHYVLTTSDPDVVDPVAAKPVSFGSVGNQQVAFLCWGYEHDVARLGDGAHVVRVACESEC